MAHTEETKAKIRAAWVERRKTFVPPLKGKHHTEETRRKMSESAKERGSNRTGAKHSLETRALISQRTRERAVRGTDCHSYKDGALAERRGERFSTEYKRGRFDVFARDKFACRHCGDARGGNLHAHHVLGFADYPDLRLVMDNGLTLCDDCHLALHHGEWSP